ncbi:MAG TPA: FIST N-terminal domain-containing protein [Thermomicrobiales bacterium]|jgi:small ligand-binding sensory domain FIST|nr:FIST N-terminal domain-containing protein [Thermomicrobiales bacterium]
MATVPPVPAAIARVGVGAHETWEVALDEAAAGLGEVAPDLVLIGVGSAFVSEVPAIADQVWRTFQAPIVLGASGRGVIAQHSEYEHASTVALMGLRLPGAILSPAHLTQRTLEHLTDPATCYRRLGAIPEDINGWIVLANPFRFDILSALAALEMAYPGAPVVGGVASPDAQTRQTALLINGEAVFDGAIALGIGGPYELLPAVSHGCEPIGQPWTITGVSGDWIESIGGRPALAILDDILQRTPQDLRNQTRTNLLVGLATDEYRTEFQRGDFVVRSIAGVDQPSGAIAIGARARPGQTIQFQLRDPAVADLDLTFSLDGLRGSLGELDPVAMVAFAGQERGRNLFGSESHDTLTIQRKFPGIPTIGLYTAGEIGPAGPASAVHSLSLTLGLIARRH